MTASNPDSEPTPDSTSDATAGAVGSAGIKPKSRPVATIMCLMALPVCAAVLILAAVYLYLNPQIPDASAYRNVKLEKPLRILSQEGDLLAEFGERRSFPIGMDQVPALFVRALVDTEDKRFYSHQGVDFISLLNDSLQLLLSGDIAGGASTLTMQLARNVSFSLEQRFIRKFKEMLLAMKIERQLSKEEILNLYINLVPFGKRAYGAEAAAQTYYNKSLLELNLAQLAMLAGIPQAPSAGNPINGPQRALNRRNLVLGRMLTEGSITQSEHDLAVAEPITARIRRQSFDTAAPYTAEIVRQELLNTYPDLYTGGYSVTTTINSRLQQQAVAAVRRGLHAYDERHGYRSSSRNQTGDSSTATSTASITASMESPRGRPKRTSGRCLARAWRIATGAHHTHYQPAGRRAAGGRSSRRRGGSSWRQVHRRWFVGKYSRAGGRAGYWLARSVLGPAVHLGRSNRPKARVCQRHRATR